MSLTHCKPLIIHKFGEVHIIFARIGYSPNGWMDGKLACEWIEKEFDKQTKVKAGGQIQVLLLDGHSSHYTPKLLDYAQVNNIIILGYPPHCTHAL